MASSVNTFADSYMLILNEIRCALDAVDPEQVELLLNALEATEKVFVIGVGRVMLSIALATSMSQQSLGAICC